MKTPKYMSPETEGKSIVMVGAGLVGSLLSIYLRHKGNKVVLLEKRPDMRLAGNIGGRSINLALSNRGWKALRDTGVAGEVEKLAIPMSGRMMHDPQGNLTFQPYGKEGQAIYSVSRGGLNQLLLDEAEKSGVDIYFNHDCEHVNFEETIIQAKNTENDTSRAFKGDVIIGADGAFSAVRESIMKSSRFNYSQSYIDHGYKELTIPPTKEKDFALDPNALHIWPRGQFMLIALPNEDRSFTCTLFLPFEGRDSFSALKSENAVTNFFTSTFPDVLPIMPSLREDFFQNPTSSLVTVKCYPWVKNNTLILGDASHAIVPFYGQGMNSGFEDCYLLNKMIDSCNGNWQDILPRFQTERKPDADAIADLAIQNFLEMRDKVADERFLLRKKIEGKLNELYPEKWIPLYSMVTFSDIRYADALAIGKRQEAIMDEVMTQKDIKHVWEQLDYDKIVEKLTTD